MGLAIARITALTRTPVGAGLAAFTAAAGTATAVTVATQYGLGQDFSKRSPPNPWVAGLMGTSSVIGIGFAGGYCFTESYSSASQSHMRHTALGTGIIGGIAGVMVGVNILTPIARRAIADN